MSFTLATLKTAIQDYTDNSESTFVTHLPDFIKAAEEKIFKSVVFRNEKSSYLVSYDGKKINEKSFKKIKLI